MVPDEPIAVCQHTGVLAGDTLEFLLCGKLGRCHVFATDLTFGKVVLVIADTPHMFAVSQLRGEAITDHQFGTATPNIDNQLLAIVWLGMGNA